MSTDEKRQATIGEWMNWCRGNPLPSQFKHWTRDGALVIRPEIIAGSLWAVLVFAGRDMARYSDPETAAAALVRGDHDVDIGNPTPVRAPTDLADWNGLR